VADSFRSRFVNHILILFLDYVRLDPGVRLTQAPVSFRKGHGE